MTWRCAPADPAAMRFHRRLPDYAPTPIVELPELATDLGVGRVVAKDESMRLGLPAFKALGASWAIEREMLRRSDAQVLTFVAATDGNHGRAVAHFARRRGHRSVVFVPSTVPAGAVDAIADEGATVHVIDADYDSVVRLAADRAEAGGDVLVQDTAWEGYTDVPDAIVAGYDTLFSELDDQLGTSPDLIIVPAGVGSLLQAALRHYRRDGIAARTKVASVEPVNAACVFASVEAGQPVSVETGVTVLAGLNCGTVSMLAWPFILNGLDLAVTVTDDASCAALDELSGTGLRAGPCGGAPLAALRLLVGDRSSTAIGDLAHATVALLVTEGATAQGSSFGDDPDAGDGG